MRILISNDDGPDSDGLRILINFAKTIANEVFVVAPNSQRTATGHGITLFGPLTIHEKEKNFFTTNGTPADSIILGIDHFLQNKKPDFVFSGVNIGANLCDHVIYSGTAAAAREATFYKIPSIAFSQFYDKEIHSSSEINFEIANLFLGKVFEKLKNLDFSDCFYNVNFPEFLNEKCKNSNDFEDLIEFTRLGRFKRHESALELRFNPRNHQKYFWINQSEKHEVLHEKSEKIDIETILNGKISVTKICLDSSKF
jgi:5'-nucleotidase